MIPSGHHLYNTWNRDALLKTGRPRANSLFGNYAQGVKPLTGVRVGFQRSQI